MCICTGPVLYSVPDRIFCIITAVSSVSVSSVLKDIHVLVLDRWYFRYIGFGVWFNLAFQMHLPRLGGYCAGFGRRYFMQNANSLLWVVNDELCVTS